MNTGQHNERKNINLRLRNVRELGAIMSDDLTLSHYNRPAVTSSKKMVDFFKTREIGDDIRQSFYTLQTRIVL